MCGVCVLCWGWVGKKGSNKWKNQVAQILFLFSQQNLWWTNSILDIQTTKDQSALCPIRIYSQSHDRQVQNLDFLSELVNVLIISEMVNQTTWTHKVDVQSNNIQYYGTFELTAEDSDTWLSVLLLQCPSVDVVRAIFIPWVQFTEELNHKIHTTKTGIQVALSLRIVNVKSMAEHLHLSAVKITLFCPLLLVVHSAMKEWGCGWCLSWRLCAVGHLHREKRRPNKFNRKCCQVRAQISVTRLVNVGTSEL